LLVGVMIDIIVMSVVLIADRLRSATGSVVDSAVERSRSDV